MQGEWLHLNQSAILKLNLYRGFQVAWHKMRQESMHAQTSQFKIPQVCACTNYHRIFSQATSVRGIPHLVRMQSAKILLLGRSFRHHEKKRVSRRSHRQQRLTDGADKMAGAIGALATTQWPSVPMHYFLRGPSLHVEDTCALVHTQMSGALITSSELHISFLGHAVMENAQMESHWYHGSEGSY